MFGRFMKVVSYIPGLIVGVEQIFGRENGKTKQQQVVDASLLMLNFEQELRGKSNVDEKGFQEAIAQINDGVHKALKAAGILEH